MVSHARPQIVRFDVFEADLESGELRKYGRRVRLPQQAFRVFQVLVERPMQLVSREELRQSLWPADTFVEFDHGLNNAVNRLRETLGDSAQDPRFIETVPRRGYRFIAPLDVPVAQPAPANTSPPAAESPVAVHDAPLPDAPSSSRRWWVFGATVAAVLFMVLAIGWPRRSEALPPTLVVLPFIAANAAEESPEAYLAFGMTDALISELSRSGALKVISQTSAMQYKDARKPLPVIARELGVTSVVEGSVVQEGGQVRLTVQLIDARTDAHLWSQTYTSDPAAAMASQRARAREVAGLIRQRLVPDDLPAAPALQSTTPAAYEAYLKGRYFVQQPNESTMRARQFFEQAIAIDPNFAPAHAGLAHFLVMVDLVAPAEAMPAAEASARRALELDPSLAAGHAVLAFVHYFWYWDWAAAERAFAGALELDPNDALTRRWHAMFLSAMGRHETAAAEIELALALDPVSIGTMDAAGGVWSNARRFDKVIEQARHLLDLSPADPRGFIHLAIGHFFQDRFEEAVAAAEKAVEGSGRAPAYLCLLAAMQQRAGRTDAARRTVTEIDQAAAKGYVPHVFLAVAYAWMDRHDAAVSQLNRAFEQRDGYLALAKVAPWVDPLRGHAGFQDLLQRMRFPQ